jgi:hypothetical protein
MKHLKLPSPAMAVAIIALMVALGGTSYAAVALPRNSVGSTQLRAGAVTSTKIKKGAVGNAAIASSTVRGIEKTAETTAEGVAEKAAPPLVAYGSVSQSNVVSSKYGWAGTVTNPQPGIFCLTGFSGTLNQVLAGIDASTPDYGAVAEAEAGYNECPSGTDVEVQTSYGRGTLKDEAFDFVAF